MKEKPWQIPSPSILFPLATITTLLMSTETMVEADPRAQKVQMTCRHQREHNPNVFVPSFVATMESISQQLQTSSFGVAVNGSGMDTAYSLVQCYGDLPLVDCTLCYTRGRILLPKCFPFTGGYIFLDGCFMRSENYSFFEEFNGGGDKAVCGGNTQMSPALRDATVVAVHHAVAAAPENNGYLAAAPAEGNESPYVLVQC
ncbi:cysteine-rich receptor-like protein kinase 2 [Malania oleifera]|uniref:cysteine-rich receptor-like protein kinase 2 n=1 Tax=Malania oleifera TaxID=397392 RepID=UPI0025ADD680|nr:cysteine-rich receptor-like protein kinase 2 [Malania oleifera]